MALSDVPPADQRGRDRAEERLGERLVVLDPALHLPAVREACARNRVASQPLLSDVNVAKI